MDVVEPMICCQRMRAQIEHACPDHPRRGECPDQLVGYSAKFDEYGLWIRTGEHASASSWLAIDFCPWCGTALPVSRRDEWFDRVEALDLDARTAPTEMEGYGWWA